MADSAILVTPMPEDHAHILAVARRYAGLEVEAQLRANGVRLTLVPYRDIVAKANGGP